LDSLLAQTMEDYEIILINDGSRDGSGTILEEYRLRCPEKIRVLTVENGGQGRARNLALEIARGDWLGFADSDDWAAPEMFEKLWRAGEESGADLVVCDVEERWADGRRVYDPLTCFERPIKISTAVWNKLVRRSTLGDVRFAEGLWYEDLAYVIELVLRTDKIVTVPEPLYYYRCGHTSTMNNNNARRNRDLLKVLDMLRTPLQAAGRQADYESLVLNHALLDGINRLQRQQGTEKRQVIGEMRDYVNRQIPHLLRCQAFRQETPNRRLAMWLNYHGLERVSGALLKLKNG
jgi:glycosyltransferase involved in cell wall biosynthesis